MNKLAAANETPTSIACHPDPVLLSYSINYLAAIQSGLGVSGSYACHRCAARLVTLKNTSQAPEQFRPPQLDVRTSTHLTCTI